MGAATTLVAKFVQQVNSRSEAESLSAADRAQFIVAVGGIVGGKKLPAIYKNLAELMMGVMKLQLFRGTTHAYDVWINTVVDDGSVMLPDSAKHSGIGISQTRVYDKEAQRDAECEAIYQAIYKSGVKYPPFVEADWS